MSLSLNKTTLPTRLRAHVWKTTPLPRKLQASKPGNQALANGFPLVLETPETDGCASLEILVVRRPRLLECRQRMTDQSLSRMNRVDARRIPGLTYYRETINWYGDCQLRLPEDRAVVAAAA
jgi:hypothetical protein